MKKCTLNCEFQHEGFCAIKEFLYDSNGSPIPTKLPKCTAKTNADLVCSECGKESCVCDAG